MDELWVIPDDARAERWERRAKAVERQVAHRIERIEDLERQLAHVHNEVTRLSAENSEASERWESREAQLEARAAAADAAARASEAELVALLNTKTMRLARRPRSLYTSFRATPSGRRLLDRLKIQR